MFATNNQTLLRNQSTKHCLQPINQTLFATNQPNTVCNNQPNTVCNQSTKHCLQPINQTLLATNQPNTVCIQSETLFATNQPDTVCNQSTKHCLQQSTKHCLQPINQVCNQSTKHCLQPINQTLFATNQPNTVCNQSTKQNKTGQTETVQFSPRSATVLTLAAQEQTRCRPSFGRRCIPDVNRCKTHLNTVELQSMSAELAKNCLPWSRNTYFSFLIKSNFWLRKLVRFFPLMCQLLV